MRGYLFDLDGTLYRGDRLLPGADRAVAELRRRGRRIVFLSNKPIASRRDYAAKLTRLGIPASEEEVINSSYVLARLLAKRVPQARVYAIGEPPLLRELEAHGLVLTTDPEEIQIVIAAFDRTFHYDKLNIAYQAIRRGARFWATNPDRTCPVEDGEIPDAAGVIAAIEAVTGKRVELVAGKPSRFMVEAALERLDLPPERCTIVGDRWETDVVMGKTSGLTTILVLTGVTPPEALEDVDVQPDYVLKSVAELPALDARLNPNRRV